MSPTKVGKLAPVTLGHMRSQGCRDLLVYCNSGRCNHSTIMNVGHLPDETPIKSLAMALCVRSAAISVGMWCRIGQPMRRRADLDHCSPFTTVHQPRSLVHKRA